MTTLPRLVIAIDGLRASGLSAYGNATITTVGFDRFAAQGVTHDFCFVPASSLSDVYAALWPTDIVPEFVVTDDAEVAALASQRGCEVDLVEATADTPAELFSETLAARVFDQVCQSLAANPRAGCVWIHLRGFLAPWDAPSQVAASLADDEDDPVIPAGVTIPSFELSPDDDDALFVASCRYHAQVVAIDACLDAFLTWVEERAPDLLTQACVVGTRGFSLGEHGHVGPGDQRLYSEVTHVPCLVRSNPALLSRQAGLVWLHEVVHQTRPAASHAALQWQESLSVRCLRTSDWFARLSVSGEADELYVKPDDRWEANDVASRCVDVLAELAASTAAESG